MPFDPSGPVTQWAKAVSACNGEPQPQSEQDPEKKENQVVVGVVGAPALPHHQADTES